MKATDTPAQCLAIAKTVESTIPTEKLSKNFLQNINKLESTEVDAVSKKKGFKGPGCKQSRGWNNIATVGVRPSAGTVGLLIPQRNVQLMEKSASLTRRRDISSNSAGALSITGLKAVVVVAESPGRTCMI